ncbi:unnamed protein product [Coregonus sp. 'balchen']|nr:unnamed protein product [Coregonus sp. 'balchen']
MAAETQKLSLKREVGLIGAISFIAGTMMGSGIFMSPQSVLVNIGSPGASLVIWAACGLLATLGSLCYAELGTVISESGGEYIYILRIFGQVVAFMFVFSFVIVMRPASATGIALSFAEYAVAPFYHDCTPPELVVKCVAAAGIVMLAIVNSMNVRLAMFIQVFSMVIKLVALAVIIIGGVVLLFKGNTENFEDSFKGTNVEISSIGISLYQGLWSYDGWNTLNYVTEELKRPEFVLSYIGSPGASLVIWTLSGLVAMLGALSYAELGTIIKESGGDFIYILRIYGQFPAFFVAFTFLLVVKPASIAAISLSFAEYAVAPFYQDCSPPQLIVKCAAVVAVMVVAMANILNVRLAMRIQVVFLVAKLFALMVIVIGGIVIIAQVNVSYLAAMTPRELMSSSAVAVTWGNKVLGSWGWVMSIAAALSAFGSLNGTFFSGGRVCFVAAREGHMPDILAMAHVNRLTPSPALIFTTAISLLVLIPGDFQSIVNFFSFTAWFFYAITLSGLLYLKIKKPELPRPYRQFSLCWHL